MPALVETMVSRDVPWHGLGTVTGELLTAGEALRVTGLDFDPIKAPTYIRMPDGTLIENPESFAMLRSTDLKVIGPRVGKLYKGNAPRAVFDLLDTMVDDGSAKYETFGTLKDGRMMFVTMRIPSQVLVGGVDPVDLYIVAIDTYDGSSPFTIIVTPVVVVCTNTASMALKQAQRKWTVRHTSTIEGKVEEGRRSMALTFRYVEEFEAAVQALVNADMVMRDAEAIVRAVLPGEPAEGQAFTDAQDTVLSLFQSSTRITEDVRGTKWGLYNAFTEYGSWIAPLTRKSKRSDAERLTESVWFGSAVDLSQRAYAALVS